MVTKDGSLIVAASVNHEWREDLILAQKVNLEGQTVWQEGGIRIDTHDGPQVIFGGLPAEDVDGMYILAARAIDGPYRTNLDPYLQKVSGEGELLWGDEGRPIGWPAIQYRRSGDLYFRQITPIITDGAGGVIIAGTVTSQLGEELNRARFQRVTRDGDLPWGEMGVVPDTSLFFNIGNLLPDDGGALFCHVEHANYYNQFRSHLYAVRIDRDGRLSWKTEVAVARMRREGISASITPLHGVYAVLWTERYHHTALMYLDRNGEQLWDEPLLLVQPTGNDTIRNDSTVFYNPYIIPYDSSVICAWQKVNSNESSPNYAQRVDYGGDKLWNGGDPLLVFPDKWPTYLLPVSNNGAIMSNGQGSIIQLHFINADGQLGQIKTGVKILPPEDTPQNSEHLLPGLFPIPANSQINIKFSEDFQKVNQIVLLDPSGRTVIRLPLPRSSITTIPLYDFPSGAYFLRFNIDANTQYAPLLILK